MRRRWSPASKLFAVLALACGVGAYVVVSGYARKLEALRPAVGVPVPVVVAAHDLARGAQLQPSMLDVEQVPSAFAPPGAFDDPDETAGRTLLAPLAEGEPLTSSRLASERAGPVAALVPPGLRAFVVTAGLPRQAVSPGDLVDVLATFGGGRPHTETVAEGVEVLSILDPGGDGSPALAPGPGGVQALQLVLLVTPDLASRLAYAQAFADLSVTIAPAEGF